MAAPNINPLPDAPTTSDSKSSFNEKAFAFVNALETFSTQINALVEWLNSNISAQTINHITGTSYSLIPENSGQFIYFTNVGAKTVVVSPESTTAQPPGGTWNFHNTSGGSLTFSPGDGVTINAPASGSLIVPAGGAVSLVRLSANTYVLIGLTEAS